MVVDQAGVEATDPVGAKGVFGLGSWWAVNSFVRVTVTDEHLLITPVTGWRARRRTERRVPLSQVAIRSRQIRRSFIGRPDVIVCKMSVAGKPVVLKAKNFPYAIRVLDAVQQSTAR